MYYEINVSKNGRHYFATAKHSIDNKEKAREIYKALKERFLEQAGFKITVSYHPESGEYLDWDQNGE